MTPPAPPPKPPPPAPASAPVPLHGPAGHRAARTADGLAAAALERQMAGATDEAEHLFRQALAIRPDHADSLHGLGVLALGRGQGGQAIAFIGRATRIRPEAAHYYINLGLALCQQGHVEEARAALQVAVLRGPDDPRAHAALGGVLEMLGRDAEAEAAARAAVSRDPLHGRPDASAPGASALLGRLQARSGQLAEAVASLRAAVAEQPADPQHWHWLGAVLAPLGRLDEAEAAFREVVRLQPQDPAPLANLGGLVFERHRPEEAVALLRGAIALAPPSPATRSNLALALMALGELEEAERELAQAAALAPEQDGILVNRASILAELGDYQAAEECLRIVERRAAPDSPDAARARFNRATVLLATGRRREGWAAFEARRALVALPGPALPDWDGEPLPAGSSLLLVAEQGLGDAIQFLRYVPLAAARAPVVLALPEPLLALARCLGSGRCRLVLPGEAASSGCAVRAGLLSLPHLLGKDGDPPAPPYLRLPDAEPWVAAAGDWIGRLGSGRKVGLAWAGNPGYRFDRRRSLRLEALAPLARARSVRFVSLQQGEAAGQAAPAGLDLSRPPIDADLAQTAALIERLDLVVSIDSAVAHLAGALGRPVWLLNRFGGDWRWQSGFIDGAGRSLWYPTLRQFRQARPDEGWADVLETVAQALE